MASGVYNNFLFRVFDRTIDVTADTFKVMPVKSTYTLDATTQDEDVLTNAASHEIVATNYTGGHGGSGRKTCAVTFQRNDTNDPGRLEVAFADVQWTSPNLGGAANDTLSGYVVFCEKASDAASIPVCFFETANVTTDGATPITVDFAALGSGGNLQITCTRT